MNTMELLDRAVAKSKSERDLSIAIGLNPTALGMARFRGRLSTAVAIVLAERLGENVAAWAIQAEQENARSAPLRRRLAAVSSRLKS